MRTCTISTSNMLIAMHMHVIKIWEQVMLEGRSNREKKIIGKDKLDVCVGEEVQVQ